MGTTARLVVCMALLASGLVTMAPTSHVPAAAQEPFTPSIRTDRVAGQDRYATAARVSQAFFETASTVYVATGRNFADALAGGPRAAQDGAPILLVSTDSVPKATADELRRLRPSRIVVLGGTAAVSDAVRKELAAIAPVRRLAGLDRFATAVQISADGFPRSSDDAYVATGRNFPDALTGGVAGGIVGAPVLLSETDTASSVTRNELVRLAPSAMAVLGGTAALAEEVAIRLDLAVTDGELRRLAGPDRYTTAVKISRDTHVDALAVDTVFLATGANFPDALAAAPAIAREGGSLLLTRTDCVPLEVRDEIARLAPERIVVLGGTGVVSNAAAALTPCDDLPPLPSLRVQPQPSTRALPPIDDSRPRPVATITSESGTAEFVEDEVVVMTDDQAALDSFLTRTGGTVLRTTQGFADLPATHLVHVTRAPSAASVQQVPANLQWLSWHATGTHDLSSRRARDTLVSAVDGLTTGLSASLNFVAEPTAGPTSDVRAGLLDRTISESKSSNPFKWPELTREGAPGMGVAEAWRLLAVAEDDDEEIDIAIIDGGFAAENEDYPEGVTGNDGQENVLPCGGDPCPWHGTDVAIAAAGQINNMFGSVGAAGPVGRLTLITHTGGIAEMMAAIIQAVQGGADIINMSFSGSMPALLTPMLRSQEEMTRAAAQYGVHLFASAGNEPVDVDAEDCFIKCWEERWHYPCENDGVICVGGLAENSLNKHPDSAYGRESCGHASCHVDIFAPYVVRVGGDPADGEDGLRWVPGTSFSAPYVAGIMALIEATGLPGAYTRVEVLASTAKQSPDPNVGRVVDAYAAVRNAYARQGIDVDADVLRIHPPVGGFATALGDDQGTYRGLGESRGVQPSLLWVTELPGYERNDNVVSDYPAPVMLHHDAGLALYQPRRKLRDGSTVNELVAVDTMTGDVAWTVRGILGCPVAVDGNGRIWGLLEGEPGTIGSLVSVEPTNGIVVQHDTTVEVLPDLGFAGNVCGGVPLRLSSNGRHLLMVIEAFWGGNWHKHVVVWDVTRPRARLQKVVHLDGFTDPGQGAVWKNDIRVAPASSPGAGSIYLLEQTAGPDPDNPFDNENRIHALRLGDLPPRASILDEGVIDRSVTLEVARISAAAIVVRDDTIYVSGAEEQGLYTRVPAQGSQVTARNFRVTDTGAIFRINGTGLGRTEDARQAGDHGRAYAQLTAGDETTLVGLPAIPGGVAGMDAANLRQTFEHPDLFCHGNPGAADSRGRLYLAEGCEDLIVEVRPSGTIGWRFDTGAVQHCDTGIAACRSYDLSSLANLRVEAVTSNGTIIVTGWATEKAGFEGTVMFAIS